MDISRDEASPVNLMEVSALVKYASEIQFDDPQNVLQSLNDSLLAYGNASEEDKPKQTSEILKNYSLLTNKTFPVTGHTIIETRRSRKFMAKFTVFALFLILLAIINDSLAILYSNSPMAEEGLERFIFDINISLRNYLGPFIWGAIGACVYLLKRLYDVAQNQEFDSARLSGWQIRIILGSLLGAVVCQIFDSSMLSANMVELDARALAFFAGLGIKVFYGAFEKIIEVLGEKLNLESVKGKDLKSKELINSLKMKRAKIDPETEPERYRLISELIDIYGSSN